MSKDNQIIIIAGPTASGKSQLAIDVAKAVDGVVINADSMQIYQDTPILSAVPSQEEQGGIEHKLYEVFPSSRNGTVVEWLNLAVAEIERVWEEGKIPVVCGGTGLYLDNLINGTTPIPEVDVQIREKVAQMATAEGIPTLHAKLAQFDPVTAERLSPNDSTRVKRATEVYLQTKKPLSEWHQKPMIKRLPDAKFFVVKIQPFKEELDERCFCRFEKMLAAGALEEVKKLKEKKLDKNLPAMKALGVPELINYLDGKSTLAEAVDLAKLHTRQYAKRQRTWFVNKLQADIVLEACYCGDKKIVAEIADFFSKKL